MRLSILTTVVAVVIGAAGEWTMALAQKGGGCRDVETRWFIYPVATLQDGTTVPSAIQGDGNWYSSGAGGTSNTVIHICGADPTYDSTMAMSSKRKLSVSFLAPVSGSVLQESVSGTYLDSAFMNLRNILCVGCTLPPGEPFTTHMAFQLSSLSRDVYRLRFMPHVTDAPDRHINPDQIPAENVPFESSPVLVIPQPYNCTTGGSTKPSWIVRGTVPTSDGDVSATENLQVGTLSRVGRTAITHAGQYSMPFEMRIEALSCFSY